MDEYVRRVQCKTDSFIDDNLSGVKNVQYVSQFFASHEWYTGCYYIHIAMQEKKFSEEEYKGYQTLWLCDNHM